MCEVLVPYVLYLVLVCSCYMFVLYIFFFFFKQKTAYELRISDWSSDVCSSDLHAAVTLAVETRTGCPSARNVDGRRHFAAEKEKAADAGDAVPADPRLAAVRRATWRLTAF